MVSKVYPEKKKLTFELFYQVATFTKLTLSCFSLIPVWKLLQLFHCFNPIFLHSSLLKVIILGHFPEAMYPA